MLHPGQNRVKSMHSFGMTQVRSLIGWWAHEQTVKLLQFEHDIVAQVG
jgi:hypothetical protein